MEDTDSAIYRFVVEVKAPSVDEARDALARCPYPISIDPWGYGLRVIDRTVTTHSAPETFRGEE